MPIADRTIRRLIPAVPALSRIKPLMWPLDLIDRVLSLPYREFRDLPPNHMRIRVGVGNRILFNAAQFRAMPIAFWLDALERGVVRLDSNIVDLGCGCGRFALTLRDLWFHDRTFGGKYLGVDVDGEMLEWCRGHFPAERYSFHKVNAYSRTYNPGAGRGGGGVTGRVTGRVTGGVANGVVNGVAGHDPVLVEPKPMGACGAAGPLELPLAEGSQDFVFANSLFSHLLEAQFLDYLRESARVLRAGGTMQFSVFCLEHVDRGAGSRWSFGHPLGPAHVESLRYPEAAVAYGLGWLEGACRDAGFSRVEVMPSTGQTMMRCAR